MKVKIKDKIQHRVFKKTFDGLATIALRMYGSQDDIKDFRTFFESLIQDTPEQFYSRPLKKVGEEKYPDVHD